MSRLPPPQEEMIITASRRTVLLGGLLSLAGLGWLAVRAWPSFAGGETAAAAFPFVRSEEEWRRLLTPTQYAVLRQNGTEPPFSSPLNAEKRSGLFRCAGCGQAAYRSENKYDSGTGWPSFWTAIDGAVATSADHGLFMVRTEVHCSNCGSHHGHVFPDGPPPTGLRYCINGVALIFEMA